MQKWRFCGKLEITLINLCFRKLKGRHIVEFFGTYCDGTARDYAGNPKAGLVMEYCPVTLNEKLFERR